MLCQVLGLHGVGDILTIISLVILSIQDIKFGEIHYRYLLLIVGFSHLEGYLLIIIFIVFYSIVENLIGGADLLIFGCLITKYGLYNMSVIVFYASLFGLIYAIALKKNKLRFIPFILFGFLMFLQGGK